MTSTSVAWTRALVGLAQGIALYLLHRAAEARGWPATEPLVFAALLVPAIFVPVIVVAGLSNLRPRTLAIWAVLAAAACAGLGFYDIFRDPLVPGSPTAEPRLLPTLALWAHLALALFIVHALIVAAAGDRRLVATYPTHFDVAWKHGVQIALAGSFVGAFWALLFLGASLFHLIGITFLDELIRNPWFYVPATTVAFATAVHVTDARVDLVRGVRTLALALLAWLLPLMTAFAIAFLVALLFTGLEPLWRTRYATVTLLAATAALVFLINAAYQDGRSGETIAMVVRWARSAAALVLVPLVGIAAYGLGLRAMQYGWTPPRIVAGALVVVAGCCAVGYALAALRGNLAMKWLEPTNVVAAYAAVAVVLALFSPVADPARIAVADQLRRLETGRVALEQFDFRFLRFRSGRYGTAALEQLAARTEGPQAGAISERARQAKNLLNPWQPSVFAATMQSRGASISVIQPPGQPLPESFLSHDWSKDSKAFQLPRCLTATDTRCEAVLLDLDGDGSMEVLLFIHRGSGSYYGGAFKAGPDERWTWLGPFDIGYCPAIGAALAAGEVKAVEPQLKEIDVNGIRLRIITGPACPPSR